VGEIQTLGSCPFQHLSQSHELAAVEKLSDATLLLKLGESQGPEADSSSNGRKHTKSES
jgi:hypothetical protein